jgi:hypothetical protein
MKIRQVGAELFHAYRRTDMTDQVVAFHNFANVPINETAPSANPPSIVHASCAPMFALEFLNSLYDDVKL